MRKEICSTSVNPYRQDGEIGVLFSGHSRTFPRHKLGPQIYDYFLVHAVSSGRGYYISQGIRHELGAGDCFFIFPGDLVTYSSDETEPWRYRWIGFQGSAAEALLKRAGITRRHPVLAGDNQAVLELFTQVESLLKAAQAGCDLRAGAMFRLALAEWADAAAASGRLDNEPGAEEYNRVEHAVRWLKLQFMRPLTIEEMAGELGYHRTYLSKIFKRQVGMPPVKYLAKLRMERARELLCEPLTIEQIAYSVGFNDPLYFSKQYKTWFGCSPSDYRLSLRESRR